MKGNESISVSIDVVRQIVEHGEKVTGKLYGHDSGGLEAAFRDMAESYVDMQDRLEDLKCELEKFLESTQIRRKKIRAIMNGIWEESK